MLIYVQAVLVLLGAILLINGQVRLGPKTLGPPVAPVVGLALVAPLPLCILLNVLLGFLETASGNFQPNVWELHNKYDWVDPTITVVMVLVAGGLTVIGLKNQNADPLAAEMAAAQRSEPDPAVVQPSEPPAADAPVRTDDAGAFFNRNPALDPDGFPRERD